MVFPFSSSLWVKICGLTQPEQAVGVAQLGASAVGFIGVSASPRYVTPRQIQQMGQALDQAGYGAVDRVGVFADAPIATVAETVDIGGLTMLQLHGQESPADCAVLKRMYPILKLIKAFRVRSPADLGAISPYLDRIDGLLLDAYHPHLLGGTGNTLDWQTLSTFRPQKPWILAGGLTPSNVGEALTHLAPDGIDLSSGVETRPGNKDLRKVEQLFVALRPASAPESANNL